MKARKSKVVKALWPVQTTMHWACVREKSARLGTRHSCHEDTASAQEPVVLRGILKAALAAYKAWVQGIKLFPMVLSLFRTNVDNNLLWVIGC